MAAELRSSARLRRAIVVALVGAVLLASAASIRAQQGTLDAIRSDVRTAPPPAPPSPPSGPSNSSSDSGLSSDNSDFTEACAVVIGGIFTAPFWAPHLALDDSFATQEYFARFPYDNTPGYLTDAMAPSDRWFALRLDADYVEAFDHLDLINGHFLFSTAQRLEVDGRIEHLGENLSNGQTDQLWIGDCNVMFRFAQSSAAQFRAGLGINWMTDPAETDLGFNFTYGIDLFPVKPLIFSAVMDAGTLGHAGLFRFRTTAGIAYKRLEFYTGYEYTDIGRTHWNGLIGGARLWF